MIGLRRLLNHSDQPDFLDLEASGAGRWCLQSLNSSVRELRMSAGRTLKIFLQSSHSLNPEVDVFDKNMTNSIAFLRTISDKNQEYLVESCISAWGQVGQIAREDELVMVLIKLVEYLSSHNNLTSSFAFSEILSVAEARDTTPYGLMEPYWRNLAYLTTKNMNRNPQASRAVAELLQLSINELLLLIQSHALPWLVLHKSNDVIQKIAEARQEKEIWRPLVDDSNNLATTLSLLLMQDQGFEGAFAKQRLDSVSRDFESSTIHSLLQKEPVLVSLELLKAAADQDPTGHSEVSVLGLLPRSFH